ncbi:hypothetical protein [Bacillus thuringiensis phage MZTP02]|uniref:Uncharacterized protein n=1 Tax=Bacillus thuringiensis phage MZTP02 TaxID=311221 RepID=Q58QF5_9CAUD|nr:hypothetical protein [Bacillus thuringiensis phage MZTP02]
MGIHLEFHSNMGCWKGTWHHWQNRQQNERAVWRSLGWCKEGIL